MTIPDFTARRLPNLPRKPIFVPHEDRWPEHTQTNTLDRQRDEAREAMGEAKWRELNAEFEGDAQ